MSRNFESPTAKWIKEDVQNLEQTALEVTRKLSNKMDPNMNRIEKLNETLTNACYTSFKSRSKKKQDEPVMIYFVIGFAIMILSVILWRML